MNKVNFTYESDDLGELEVEAEITPKRFDDEQTAVDIVEAVNGKGASVLQFLTEGTIDWLQQKALDEYYG